AKSRVALGRAVLVNHRKQLDPNCWKYSIWPYYGGDSVRRRMICKSKYEYGCRETIKNRIKK
ncbi:MAG: hypothetical protein M3146_02835, partial [Thermoproteota archaeon]|nr:hypothetical protein [Thermoproteota archaeon]